MKLLLNNKDMNKSEGMTLAIIFTDLRRLTSKKIPFCREVVIEAGKLLYVV